MKVGGCRKENPKIVGDFLRKPESFIRRGGERFLGDVSIIVDESYVLESPRCENTGFKFQEGFPKKKNPL